MPSIILLVRKDIYLMRKFMLLLILYFVYMAAINFENLSMFAAFPALLLLINSCSVDIIQQNERFLVSLPVERHHIVLAKYMAVIPFTVFGTMCTVGLYSGGLLIGYEAATEFWKDLGLSMLGVPLFAALYLPVYYWLGPKGKGAVNIVFMLISLFVVSNIVNIFNRSPLLAGWITDLQNEFILQLIAVLFYIIVLSCSYLLSERIFSRRDL